MVATQKSQEKLCSWQSRKKVSKRLNLLSLQLRVVETKLGDRVEPAHAEGTLRGSTLVR